MVQSKPEKWAQDDTKLVPDLAGPTMSKQSS